MPESWHLKFSPGTLSLELLHSVPSWLEGVALLDLEVSKVELNFGLPLVQGRVSRDQASHIVGAAVEHGCQLFQTCTCYGGRFGIGISVFCMQYPLAQDHYRKRQGT